MAKAGEATSTTDWIWLREALALAVAALGSVALAKERLQEWLAAGKVPWFCMAWEGLDAEGIAKLQQELGAAAVIAVTPSAAYCEGDPGFWGNPNLRIDWDDNNAREREEVTGGAKAQGVKVSRACVLALLPAVPNGHKEAPQQAEPAERKLLEPKAWLAKARKEHPQQRNEGRSAYAGRLHALMREAPVKRTWQLNALRRRLYDK